MTVVCGVIYCSLSDDLKAHQEFRFQLTECLEKSKQNVLYSVISIMT